MTPLEHTELQVIADKLDRLAARLDSVLILVLMAVALAAVTLVLVATGGPP